MATLAEAEVLVAQLTLADQWHLVGTIMGGGLSTPTPPAPDPDPKGPWLVDIRKAVQLTGLSEDVLYKPECPFAVRDPIMGVRFSTEKIRRWIDNGGRRK